MLFNALDGMHAKDKIATKLPTPIELYRIMMQKLG